MQKANTTPKTNETKNTNPPAKTNQGKTKEGNAALTAYTLLCQEAMKQGQVHGRTAYQTQALLLANKEVTKEAMQQYKAFCKAVTEAEKACMAVKGKVTDCGVFNYLDGRETGYKVATGLGNSIRMRAFRAGMVQLANKAFRLTQKENKKNSKKEQPVQDQITPTEAMTVTPLEESNEGYNIIPEAV